MIKGVNRQVVEVRETQSDYFERILFFVRPEYAGVSEGKIRERAGIIASGAGSVPATKLRGKTTTVRIAVVLSLLCGIALGILIGRMCF
ncbi:MAG: hypothetical protein PUC33_02480 [Oscillospiraceae bacterium]|nr:hypothetical protein [Oscillospiraceae bacterium]